MSTEPSLCQARLPARTYSALLLIGGIAICIAFTFSVLMVDISLSSYWMLFAGSLLLVVVGAIDDLYGLSVSLHLVAQIAASLLMALGGTRCWSISATW